MMDRYHDIYVVSTFGQFYDSSHHQLSAQSKISFLNFKSGAYGNLVGNV